MKVHILDAAEQVLREAGEPLHYVDITKRMTRDGLWASSGKTPERTVRASLSVDLKQNPEKSRFVRCAPGVFGLRSAGHPAAVTPARTPARQAEFKPTRGARKLTELERVLKKVSAPDHLEAMVNESKTRSYMVDPILASLGWGPRTLEHELSTGPRGRDKVDIALRPDGPHGEVKVMVEVKSAALETSDKHLRQLLEYCRLEDVKLGLLTNGRTWKFYYGMHAKQKDYFAEEVDITKGTRHVAAAARRLEQFLGFDNVSRGEAGRFIKQALQKRRDEWPRILEEQWKASLPALTAVLERAVRASGREAPEGEVEAFVREQINLQEVADSADALAPQPGPADAAPLKGKPTHIELFGEQMPFPNYRNSLKRFLEEMYDQNPDSLQRLMERRPKIFVSDPETGRFRAPFEIGASNVWVETSLSANAIQKLIQDVCRYLKLQENAFRLIGPKQRGQRS